jgi:hypothetical protein
VIVFTSAPGSTQDPREAPEMPSRRTAAAMTTESQQDTTRPGVTVLLGTAAVALVAGGALVLVGALADGAPAA